MNAIPAILIVAIALLAVFAGVWTIGRRIGKWAIVDPVWSFSIAFNAILFALLVENGYGPRKLAIAIGTLAYSIRLGGYLARRVAAHSGDDPRYTQFAKDWGERAGARMLWFFQFQALGSLALSVSIFAALMAPGRPLTVWDIIGLGIMATAIAGETIADRQLSAFKRSNSQGQGSSVCRTGLWRYSRHPNYFFQWTFWLAFIPLSASSQYWWLALISPALMYHFLNNVTGIPPTERRSLESKGEAYRAYQRETSAFFPWPPRERSSLTR